MNNLNDITHQKKQSIQNVILVTLRIVIGLHFLYEGLVKIIMSNWSAQSYLEASRWILSDIFHWIASDPAALIITDFLNVWGLIAIGIALISGIFIRTASYFGIGLLLIYYIANPPFIHSDFGIPTEGHYLFINKNLIELIALAVIAIFNHGGAFRLDLFIKSFIKRRDVSSIHSSKSVEIPETYDISRRQTLKYLASIPLLGGLAYSVYAKHSNEEVDALSSASVKIKNVGLDELAGPLPNASIADLNISRLILGGNLIARYSHSRDLIYVNQLFGHYNTHKKILETLKICESCGINSIIITPNEMDIVNKYNDRYDGNIQTIVMVSSKEQIDIAVNKNASAIYIIGNHCDWMVRDGKISNLDMLLNYIKSNGYLAGLGAHSIQALIECKEAGIIPDFYVKTLHHDKYWSAHPKENRIPFSVDTEKSSDHNQFHDNMFCLFPEQTIEFMNNTDIPWIAFKVLAGGAIFPEDGFKYAFENGADFICVGMFDFQVVDDVNIVINSLKNIANRERRLLT